jgi:hypothetical protein
MPLNGSEILLKLEKLLMDMLTREASKTFTQVTCEDSRNAIFLQGLEFGVTPSELVVGQTTDLFGQVPALANLSARQAKELRLMTSGTYGPHSITSSKSASLQSSLENKLRAKTLILGSTLYALTWKAWITPSGRYRSRLRGSVRRTCETEFIGWPTPTTRDYKDTGDLDKSMKRKDGKMRHDTVPRLAHLSGWPTPLTSDANKGGNVSPRKNGMALPETMAMLRENPQPARLTVFGEMLIGCFAEMESGGQLNPAHSRWLMGLPPVWDVYAPMAMQSMRKQHKHLLSQ